MFLRDSSFECQDGWYDPVTTVTKNYVDFPQELITMTTFNRVGRMKN